MGTEIIASGGIQIDKRTFHHRKNLILFEDLDVDKIQVRYLYLYGFFW